MFSVPHPPLKENNFENKISFLSKKEEKTKQNKNLKAICIITFLILLSNKATKQKHTVIHIILVKPYDNIYI